MARRLALAAAAAATRIRQRQKAESLRRAEEATAVRAEPLGQDRRFNRYWHFVAGGEDCPAAGAGRIFVEPRDGAGYLLLSEPQQLSLLLDSLETRGPREKALYDALLRHKDCMISNMPGQPLEMPEGGSPGQQEEGQQWLHTCHLQADAVRAGHPFVAQAMAQRQGMSPFSKLQADMVRVQAAVPATALAEDFDREAWQQQVQAAEQVVQLRQALAVLEGALSEEWLSPLFQRTPRHHQAPRSEDEPMPDADADADQPIKAEPGVQSQGLPAPAELDPVAQPGFQAYHHMQRPAPLLSTMGLHGPGGDFRMLDPAGRMVSGAPIALGSSRMKAVLFPSFAVSTNLVSNNCTARRPVG
eukprot:jgi/Astpho2/6673/Aster-x0287